MSEAFNIELGSPLPLSFQMPDAASGLAARARVYDSSDVEVAGSPFTLTEVGATARYTNAGFTPLVVGTFTARFVPYTDGGFGTEAVRFSRDQDSYSVESTGHIERIVYCDLSAVSNGVGTAGDPTDSADNAITQANAIGALVIDVRGAGFFTPTGGSINGMTIRANVADQIGIIPTSLVSMNNANLIGLTYLGTSPAAQDVRMSECVLLAPSVLPGGLYINCSYSSTTAAVYTLQANQIYKFKTFGPQRPESDTGTAFIDFNSLTTIDLTIDDANGAIVLRGMTLSSDLAEILGTGIKVVIESNCTAGETKVAGTGELQDSSGVGHTVDRVGFIEAQDIQIIKALGGLGNYFLDNTTYDSNKLLTVGRVRVFPTAALATAATDGGIGEGEIATLDITATSEVGAPELPNTVRGVLS